MADITALTRIIEPHVAALGFDLVRVKLFGGESDPTLQVMAERRDTRQLVVEDCASISRALSDVLDEADPIENAYRLEVSSPGIDRPLTRLSDFADWAGHEARIRFAEPVEGRKSIDARLAGVEGEVVQTSLIKSGEAFRFTLDQVASAKLLLTDALIKATAPLSTEGADVIQLERV
jgi:ribosome maturation factor RimP